jgi:NADPH:quinone reductase-like Zn-dependent oxidoreductase
MFCKVGELDKPAAEPGKVLVTVHVTSVNPSDTKSRSNRPLLPESRAKYHIKTAPASSKKWAKACPVLKLGSAPGFTRL